MREDGSPSALREAFAAGRGELMLYAATGVVYIALGVVFPELLFAWIVAVGFLLVSVSLLPALLRRLRS